LGTGVRGVGEGRALAGGEQNIGSWRNKRA
jgi:hypothetical protein